MYSDNKYVNSSMPILPCDPEVIDIFSDRCMDVRGKEEEHRSQVVVNEEMV